MSKHSEELSYEEIETSIDVSDKLQGVFDYINAMQYKSQIKEFWRKLPRISLQNKFTSDEVDVIAATARRKDLELSAKSIGATAATWSPSANIPEAREPDWMERAANDDTDR